MQRVQRHGVYSKLTNSYKLVSSNVLLVMTYEGFHTVTRKITKLCYIKPVEFKALDCRLKTTSAF
ncbi:TPA: hypothetical protein QCX65_003548 [Bacillus mycoides]|nr:hypothetical protein BGP34_30180 [Bacillus mycoides]HDR7600142.1 hypothetical protein [Bacillus mycoides]